jgi:hypothetical protein
MLHKQKPTLSPNARVFVDSGYQGIDKLHEPIECPYKVSKKQVTGQERKRM